MRKRRIKLVVGLAALLAGIILVAGAPAQAATVTAQARTQPLACSNWTGWNTFGVDWGAARYCYAVNTENGRNWWRFQIDDTKTDGYAVHLMMCSNDWYGAPCDANGVPSGSGPAYLNIISSNACSSFCGAGPYCFQSAGPVTTSNWFGFSQPGPIPTAGSRINLLLVLGRCENGTYQTIATAPAYWLSN